MKHTVYMERRKVHKKFYLVNLKGTYSLGDFDIRCEGDTEVGLG